MATVGVRIFDIQIHGAQSLKEKRFVLRSLKDRINNRFNVSIAEVGHLDKWQRVELAVVTVSREHSSAEGTLDAVRGMLDREPELRIIDILTELY